MPSKLTILALKVYLLRQKCVISRQETLYLSSKVSNNSSCPRWMKIIYNRFIPFGTYWAINLFGVVFAKRQQGELGSVECNHEFIHTLQQRELLFLGFYLLYLVEWGIGLLRYRDRHVAYRNISFEREAYAHQDDMNYARLRPRFGWARFLMKKRFLYRD